MAIRSFSLAGRRRLRHALHAIWLPVLATLLGVVVGCTSPGGAGGSIAPCRGDACGPPGGSSAIASRWATSAPPSAPSLPTHTPGVPASCGSIIKHYNAPAPDGRIALVVYRDPINRHACAVVYAPNDAYTVNLQMQRCKPTDIAGDQCTPASLSPGDYQTEVRSGSASPVAVTIPASGMFSVAAAVAGPQGKGSWVLGIPSRAGGPSLANGGATLLTGLGAYRP
jgi:hypothetical protein